MFLPALCFAAGILLGPLLGFQPWGLVGFALAAVFSRYRTLYLLPGLLLAGSGVQHWQRPPPDPELDAQPGEILTVAGCVIDPPAFSAGREQYVVEIAPHARIRLSMYLKEGEAPPALSYGQRIEVQAHVRKPRNFGNPGAFDYRGYLARREIYWTASTLSGSRPVVFPGSCGSPAMALLYRLRTRVIERIESLYRDNGYAIGILEALLIGESSRLERVWADDYRRTGTYHAIVISGLHITIIATALVFLLRLVFPRNTARLIAVLVIWIYAGMCGWQGPVLRAAGGFTLFAIGRFFFRECRLLNLLAALAFAFLIFDPSQIKEASFQLTFLCVLALGALAAPAVESTTGPLLYGLRDLAEVAKDMHVPPRVAQFRIEMRLLAETLHLAANAPPHPVLWLVRGTVGAVFWIWGGFVVSAALQLGLTLPMVFYFHRLSPSGLSANLIVTPLLTYAVPLGFLALVTGLSWPVGLTGWMVEAARKVTEWHASWEPNWRVPDPPSWLAAAFLASLIALALARRRALLMPPLALLSILVWHPFEPERQPGSLELTMIDVGQGDSLLIGFPDGRWMLVDGGGIPVFGKRTAPSRMDIGEDVVSPYLFGRGIRRLDIVVSTHQHEDHAAGLAAVLENFRPGELWAGATPGGAVWKGLRDRAARIGATVRNLHEGDGASLGGVALQVLAPPADYNPKAAAANNDSLVLRLTYGEHRFLLTGDAERQIESGIVRASGRVHVLKVAHHGSKTSTSEAFLNSAQPVFALISAGKDNLFHHPHPDVVRRLAEHHATIFRTDEWGLVTIRSDGKRFSVDTNRYKVLSELP